MDVREKHRSAASHTYPDGDPAHLLDRDSNPQPFGIQNDPPTHRATGQGSPYVLKKTKNGTHPPECMAPRIPATDVRAASSPLSPQPPPVGAQRTPGRPRHTPLRRTWAAAGSWHQNRDVRFTAGLGPGSDSLRPGSTRVQPGATHTVPWTLPRGCLPAPPANWTPGGS